MSADAEQCCKEIEELLQAHHQMWLFGAGISRPAGLPLMHPLTDLVPDMLNREERSYYSAIRAQLDDQAHVEHILSHIGDLIALASRSKSSTAPIGESTRTVEELRALHVAIQREICHIMRWGVQPAEAGAQERAAEPRPGMVRIDAHTAFAEALFYRRAGLESLLPVALFTTNYDTLLEDALALSRVPYCDGFCGGAMAFWDPNRREQAFREPFSAVGAYDAKLYKLHGSIDWYASAEDVVVRRREGVGYPKDESSQVLIYPQATKYLVSQRDPFATLFSVFRAALTDPRQGLLGVCGYSFGDEHVNEEIERALKQRANALTVVVFVLQADDALERADAGLPPRLAEWLAPQSDEWPQRIWVVGSRGVYHGSLENQYPAAADKPHPWWSFQRLTDVLRRGLEVPR